MAAVDGVGRVLIVAGVVMVCLGLALTIWGRVPGDIVWRRGSTTVYVPIVTCLVLSLLLSVILGVIFRR
jgi:hypothetical protein